jgi:sterol desaturase/sphingolipid hydroxylase (fatty acid hydroxylase superfamily)
MNSRNQSLDVLRIFAQSGKSLALAFALVMFFVLAFQFCGYIVERLRPVQAKGRIDRRLNFVYTLLFQLLDLTVCGSFALGINSLVQKAPLHGLISLGSDHGRFFASIGLVLISICLGDFFYYWMHRLQHANRWLWAEHELHHSEENMNVTTAWRHHWLEKPLQTIFMAAPMAFLFKPAAITVFAATIVSQVFPYFVHLGARVDIGPLKRVFMNPYSHRIHHSKRPEHIDKNFASAFAFWDVLFGTYCAGEKGDWPETGLASGRTVKSVPEALTLPFLTWWDMLRESPNCAGRIRDVAATEK